MLSPSFLDRLLDAETVAYDVPEMSRAIGRDLEDLLNTRATHQGLVNGESVAADTILTYGLVDIGSLELCGGQQRERMAEAVRETIKRHEPRLRDVRVLIPDPFSPKQRTLNLMIEGRLVADPATWVAFEARLTRGTGQYAVEAES